MNKVGNENGCVGGGRGLLVVDRFGSDPECGKPTHGFGWDMDRLIAQGHAQGLVQGEEEGHAEARRLGFFHGRELAMEVGYYRAYLATVAATEAATEAAVEAAAEAAVAEMEERLAAGVPFDPAEMEPLRAVMRRYAAGAGIELRYGPPDLGAEEVRIAKWLRSRRSGVDRARVALALDGGDDSEAECVGDAEGGSGRDGEDDLDW